MKIGQLRSGNRSWLDVEVTGLNIQGRLAPRLYLSFSMRTPTERIRTTLKVVQVDLMWNDELLGSGTIIEESFGEHDRPCHVELPTSRRLIQDVTDRLATQTAIGFQVRFKGSAEVIWEPGENDQRFVGEPAPGVPTVVRLEMSQNHSPFSISRSDWYTRVVSRLGDTDYIPLELLIPRGATGNDWRAVVQNLQNAERAFALGDDPSVFNHLRGALDAMPGAKLNIFDALDGPKRTEVNKLVTALGQFLHTGRHVASEQGDGQGSFPVDHVDAGFALNLLKVLLSYTSRALEVATTR